MTTTDLLLARQTACGDVDEANAAIGAAISTGSMAAEHDRFLGTVQRDLLDLATDLADPGAQPRLTPGAAERLTASQQRYTTLPSPTPGSHDLAGSCDATGMLRLALAITRRAERSMRILAATEPEGVSDAALAYLHGVAELLPRVALHVEQEDPMNQPMGGCGDRPRTVHRG